MLVIPRTRMVAASNYNFLVIGVIPVGLSREYASIKERYIALLEYYIYALALFHRTDTFCNVRPSF
jgi:hypothetical protein